MKMLTYVLCFALISVFGAIMAWSAIFDGDKWVSFGWCVLALFSWIGFATSVAMWSNKI